MRIVSALVSLFLFLPLFAQDKPPAPDNAILLEIPKKAGLFPQREPSGNAIVEKKFKQAYDDYLKSLPGQKVCWSLKVQSVTEKHIVLEPFRPAPPMLEKLLVNVSHLSSIPDSKRNTHPHPKNADVAALEALRAGHYLTVTGTIKSVKRDENVAWLREDGIIDVANFVIVLADSEVHLPTKPAPPRDK